MAINERTGFELGEVDRLLTTTKQVRKRLDLSRSVPHNELLECIGLADHAPMGGNLERNRWMIIDDDAKKSAIAVYFEAVGRPYLAANAELSGDDRSQRVIGSATYLVDHLAERNWRTVSHDLLCRHREFHRVAHRNLAPAVKHHRHLIDVVPELHRQRRIVGVPLAVEKQEAQIGRPPAGHQVVVFHGIPRQFQQT